MILTCPKCKSTQLRLVSEVHTRTHRDDYDICQGLCCGLTGSIIFGPIGWLFALCGLGGEKTTEKTNNLWVCENCGHRFK